MDPGAPSTSRSPAIDVVKGLAIVAVICLHTLTAATLHRIGALFYIWQAVPVFIFLMGVNAARSLRRRGARSLRELYSCEYLASRFDRVFIPFALVFAGTVALQALRHAGGRSLLTLAVDLVTGELPIGGPGNYFITLLFQLALAFPLIYWCLLRSPMATMLGCLAINAAFEILAPHVGRVRGDPYVYEAGMTRYLFLVALGGALAGASSRQLRRSWWLWLGLAVSVGFLLLAQFDATAIPFGLRGWENSDFAAAFYPAALVLLVAGAPQLRAAGVLWQAVAEWGRASYHIFLLQIVWFGLNVWRMDSWLALAGNLLVTLTAGVVLFRAMGHLPLPGAAEVLAWRRATVIRRKLRLIS